MRYFLVFYRATYSSRSADESVFIHDDKLITSKTFPNKRTTIAQLKEEYGLRSVAITNIIEVSEKEKEQYYK